MIRIVWRITIIQPLLEGGGGLEYFKSPYYLFYYLFYHIYLTLIYCFIYYLPILKKFSPPLRQKSENMTCSDVGLPEPDNDLKIKINWGDEKKRNDVLWKYIKKMIAELNVDQKIIFNYITTKEKDSKRMFYIIVPKGTGKKFLINL